MPSKKTKPKIGEDHFTNQVAEFLEYALPRAWRFTHFPAGGFRFQKTAGKLKWMGVQSGWPDMLIVGDGRIFFIELKVGGGKLSPDQLEFQDWCTEYGFPHAVCWEIEAVEAVLRRWGIPIQATLAEWKATQ